jgi:hypothetical protein
MGDDWAGDHHDVELMDASGRRLAKARLPEGVAGMARLHAMAGAALGDDAEDGDPGQVVAGTETDQGPWVAALIAAGYTVYAINPLQASRYRKRMVCPAPRATPRMLMSWPAWCAPAPISCAPWLVTPRRPPR